MVILETSFFRDKYRSCFLKMSTASCRQPWLFVPTVA
jgi:hypothetical protein